MSYSYEPVPGNGDQHRVVDDRLQPVAVCPSIADAQLVTKALEAYQPSTSKTESGQARLL